jgi:hypothetical protein
MAELSIDAARIQARAWRSASKGEARVDCQQALLEEHLLGRKIYRVRFSEDAVELSAGEVRFVSFVQPVIVSSHARCQYPDDAAREAIVAMLGEVIMAVECVAADHISLRLDSGLTFFTDLSRRSAGRPLAQLASSREIIGQW